MLRTNQPPQPMQRRHFIKSSLALSASQLLPTGIIRAAIPAAGRLPLTHSQVLGPFYPLADYNATTVIPESPADLDLVTVRTASGILPAPVGKILHFNGQVLNRDGNAIPGAVVELWNADGNGWYIDPDSEGPTSTARDVNFQGFGSTVATEHGAFGFRTIRPAPYPLDESVDRASHLHVIVKVGGVIRLTTQLYFHDELTTLLPDDPIHGLLDEENPGDFSRIEPNLIRPVETIDRDGNMVITGHKNLVIDIPSAASSSFKPQLSRIKTDRDKKSVTMDISPGCLVDIQTSTDLKKWTTIATRQSAVYGQIFPTALPAKTFYRTQPVPLGS